ncbi:hypothetical protein P7C70_g4823, partial [Phenoliferia sp. Uapishka_3]
MSPLPVDTLRAELLSPRPSALAALSLDTRGHKKELAKRLRNAQSRSLNSSPEPPPSAYARPPGQDYNSFLVIDVEATCERMDGALAKLAFSYPNEIIEFPVLLLTWAQNDDYEWSLAVKEEYHSFVRPTWNSILSEFTTELTGITQADVKAAPTYPELLVDFYESFVIKHDLFTKDNPTCWVSDGPWDLRDFIAKASHISQTPRPPWLAGRMIDLRLLTSAFFSELRSSRSRSTSPPPPPPPPIEDLPSLSTSPDT